MAYFSETRRHSRIPIGKYRGWTVNQVPHDYLQWVNDEGHGTPIFKWLHGQSRRQSMSKKKKL
jgi:hypothetical protein